HAPADAAGRAAGPGREVPRPRRLRMGHGERQAVGGALAVRGPLGHARHLSDGAGNSPSYTAAGEDLRLDDFNEVWLVNFSFDRGPGERPTPVRLEAHERRGGRLVRFGQGGLGGAAPYPLGPEALVVVYDGPAALGCHLALGWPMPARALDLHAEFRRLTSGLLPPGDYDLPAALSHFGLEGDGVDRLESLLAALEPDLDLPRALLRGRYTAAVARMEWVGVPIDVEAIDYLRTQWG